MGTDSLSPSNREGDWFNFRDLVLHTMQLLGCSEDYAIALILTILDEFDVLTFYQKIGRTRVYVECGPRVDDALPLTSQDNKGSRKLHVLRRNIVCGVRWTVSSLSMSLSIAASEADHGRVERSGI